MRIGYDAKRLFCNQRGLGNYSRDLIRILSSFYPNNQYNLYTPEIKLQVNINSLNTRIIQPNAVYKALPTSVWRTYGITKQTHKNKDEIFHGLNQELPVGIEKTGIKTAITFHDAIFIRYPELYDKAYRKIFTLKNQRSCRIADKIIAVSEQSAQDAIRFFNADPQKVEVIYQGCNNIFRQKLTLEEKKIISEKYQLPSQYLLYVGAIEPRKNISAIIQALGHHTIDLPLVVVGRKTKHSAELIQLSEKLNVKNQIIFLEQVETSELPAIYQLASIFIYPSVFEGFGIPILEALCSETPVITSTDSCFEETGGKHTLYINPNDTEEISEAIINVAGNSELQNLMKKEGLMHSLQFNDTSIAEKIIRVYNNLLI